MLKKTSKMECILSHFSQCESMCTNALVTMYFGGLQEITKLKQTKSSQMRKHEGFMAAFGNTYAYQRGN